MGKLIMVEIYEGKHPEWVGWHNLILEPSKTCLAGPLDPETSKEIKDAIQVPRKEAEKK